MSLLLKIDANTYAQLLDEMCKGNIHLAAFLERAETSITLKDDSFVLPERTVVFNDNIQVLPDRFIPLNSDIKVLPEKMEPLPTNIRTLPDDSPILSDWYRQVFN